MRKNPKPVEPVKPVAPVAAAPQKKDPPPKKAKAPKTRVDYEVKVAERRIIALRAAIDLDADRESLTLTLSAQNKISSYLGSKKCLSDEWHPDGSRKPPVVKIGYQGVYRIRVIPADPGFIGQIFHYSNLGSPEKAKYLPVVDWATETHITPEAATKAATELGIEQGIGKRLLRNWRVWYEGERDFMADTDSVFCVRQRAIDAVSCLVVAEQATNATDDEIDALMTECSKVLTQYFSRMSLVNSWWNALGVWIGPKKPIPKGKKATKQPSHYLANFQKAIDRGDLEQANSRILHALRNDFPREILTEYMAVAAPFSGQLENYPKLREKVDLIPSEQ